MTIIWIALLVELIIAHLFYILIPSTVILTIVIGINIIVVLFCILSKSRKLALLLFFAFAIRIIFAAFDSVTLALSNTNPDTLGYYINALEWMDGTPVNRYGTLYSHLLGYIFRFCGGTRFFAEYINVLLGVTTIWIVYKCFLLLKVDEKRCMVLLWLIALFPYAVFGSSVSYRETVIGTMTVASCYYALRWYLERRSGLMIGCMACLLFAAAFHAGIVVIGAGYALLFIFYSHQRDRFHFNRWTIPVVFLFLLLLVGMYIYSTMFFTKFNGVSTAAVIRQFNFDYGGSAYLKWANADSLGAVILYSPLKFIHFLFSPLPNYWRGVVDFLAFAIDSMTYFWCIFYTLKNRKASQYSNFILAMMLGMFCCSYVFGLATWTAGTAIRHRQKMFACLLVATGTASVKSSGENDSAGIR